MDLLMKRKIYKFTRVLLTLALVASICVSAAGMVSIVNGATDSYTNNGETIKVYQTCQIDLSKEKHTEKVAKDTADACQISDSCKTLHKAKSCFKIAWIAEHILGIFIHVFHQFRLLG